MNPQTTNSFTSAAIQQFFIRASEYLAERGVQATHAAVARILGIPPSTFSNLLAGRQRVSWDVIMELLDRWRLAGWPPMAIYANHTGVLIVREDRLAMALSAESTDVLGSLGGTLYPSWFPSTPRPVALYGKVFNASEMVTVVPMDPSQGGTFLKASVFVRGDCETPHIVMGQLLRGRTGSPRVADAKTVPAVAGIYGVELRLSSALPPNAIHQVVEQLAHPYRVSLLEMPTEA